MAEVQQPRAIVSEALSSVSRSARSPAISRDLRELFLLGDELCLLGCELIQLLLGGGKLFLLGAELLNTASHGGQILSHCFKLLGQLWRRR